jgi:hypothetical protein
MVDVQFVPGPATFAYNQGTVDRQAADGCAGCASIFLILPIVVLWFSRMFTRRKRNQLRAAAIAEATANQRRHCRMCAQEWYPADWDHMHTIFQRGQP